MRGLPINEQGYPVPYFVAWVDGKPDFRVTDAKKIIEAVRFSLCWLCGQTRGRNVTYVIGPMCCVNRISSEPPSHTECADFAARACPFLTRPAAPRNPRDVPAEAVDPAGIAIKRNPGVALLWTTRSLVRPLRVGDGYLFHVGEPDAVTWYAEWRLATREEVVASFDSGVEILRTQAKAESPEAEAALARQVEAARSLLPR
jgi:hypothetical protein